MGAQPLSSDHVSTPHPQATASPAQDSLAGINDKEYINTLHGAEGKRTVLFTELFQRGVIN